MDCFSPIERAKAFAELVHRGNPYYEHHLEDNRRIAAEAGMTDDATVIICYLHDTVEDIDPAIRELAIEFLIQFIYDTHVYETVWAMTGLGGNRKERNANYYEKIGKYPPAANHKVIDRLANMEQSKAKAENGDDGHWKMYMKEDPEFHERVVKLATNETLRARYERLTGRA